eukprot:scaffold307294_cov21-Tisochrysis_lutea.AAC.4
MQKCKYNNCSRGTLAHAADCRRIVGVGPMGSWRGLGLMQPAVMQLAIDRTRLVGQQAAQNAPLSSSHFHRGICPYVSCAMQVGAVIVGANKVILGIGYNGFPRYMAFQALTLGYQIGHPHSRSQGLDV